MANTRTKTETADNEPQPRDRAEAKYPRDRLVAESFAFFGADPHFVAGALVDGRKKNFTLAEAEAALEEFRNHAVSTD